jgi:hypothetical protein
MKQQKQKQKKMPRKEEKSKTKRQRRSSGDSDNDDSDDLKNTARDSDKTKTNKEMGNKAKGYVKNKTGTPGMTTESRSCLPDDFTQEHNGDSSSSSESFERGPKFNPYHGSVYDSYTYSRPTQGSRPPPGSCPPPGSRPHRGSQSRVPPVDGANYGYGRDPNDYGYGPNHAFNSSYSGNSGAYPYQQGGPYSGGR